MEKTILIICESGISASLLVSKILESLREKELEYAIDYAPVSRIQEKLMFKNYDVLLLTPQVARYEEQIRGIVDQEKCTSKIVFMKPEDFQYMNVERMISQL
ncbi:PTS cellobiose transporter subunit IIC [Enterococcus plantarum]|uniref:PTS sugar transporter subunit IIB n=1 Tax=Enterococcus TaxID=1350 RepID=UPI00084D32BA|nr:PTS cellobiose transporter subunit IIC [Enterococcus plantarum]MBO0422490.1 PTS cellobiose transporter subunit IIC [Enterococcus plantarum]OEG17429.1 PTS cellobiose transporter subunit IIC [Enterococcus plantarum]